MRQQHLATAGNPPRVPGPSPAERKADLLTSVSHEARSTFNLHNHEPHNNSAYQEKLNRLRAAVLGANDGIVSVAATVVGVAGATSSTTAIGVAAAAAVVGGAISMALGEYVSVSSQVDSQEALIEKEKTELAQEPEAELDELTAILMQRGLSERTARSAAIELTHEDALHAHLDFELGIDAEDIPSPWTAALASAGAFFIGSMLPTLLILLCPVAWRVPATFIGVLIALAITGTLGAKWGGSPKYGRAALRVVIGGALALATTYGIGLLLGVSVA
ncbi:MULTISPECIES: VIT1/CCC1 transporter family protein [Rothia]|uniref:VIT1/CCC1 transporter family protein n=1 Tax=Rothia TaxID=32207 RepID=UPI00092922E7|nr:VIT family protein [Rothia sp. ND6WE1A]SIK02550.1 integral membrane protein [Mycobacteroides abscessus subsp. abscessus]